jgi:salicylate hydroxylase
MTETGGDFLLMAVRSSSLVQSPICSFVLQHEDVLRIVHDLAVSAGARVDFGTVVAQVSPGSPRPSVTLAGGEIITADVVIGADGPRSLVRPVVVGEQEPQPAPEGITVFGATVPAAWMETHPELEKLVKLEGVCLPCTAGTIFRFTDVYVAVGPNHGHESKYMQ